MLVDGNWPVVLILKKFTCYDVLFDRALLILDRFSESLVNGLQTAKFIENLQRLKAELDHLLIK